MNTLLTHTEKLNWSFLMDIQIDVYMYNHFIIEKSVITSYSLLIL